MISSSLFAKIGLLELATRRMMANKISGNVQTRQRGFSFEFDTLDDYQEGDDIRYIDHIRSAQRATFIVRRYREESSINSMIIVDTSASTAYGSQQELIHNLIVEVAAVVALAATYKNGTVGGVMGGDDTMIYISPRRTKASVMDFVTTLLSTKPEGKMSLVNASKQMLDRLHQRSLIIVITDGIDEDYQKAWRMLAHKHDVAVIRVLDHYTKILPPIDLFACQDSETGSLLEPLSRREYAQYQEMLNSWHDEQEAYCAAHGIDCLTLVAGKPWLEKVVHFFARRKRRL